MFRVTYISVSILRKTGRDRSQLACQTDKSIKRMMDRLVFLSLALIVKEHMASVCEEIEGGDRRVALYCLRK